MHVPEINTIFKYILVFSISPELAWISHLDLMRSFYCLFMRSGLPVAYSEGFNPHMKIVFASPLPIGVYGTGEILEFKTTKEMDLHYMLSVLSSAAPYSIKIKDVLVPANPLSDYRYASYVLHLDNGFSSAGLQTHIDGFLSQKSIVVEKQGKSGTKLIDIRDRIVSVSSDNPDTIDCVLNVSSENYLSPIIFSESLSSFLENECGIRLHVRGIERSGFIISP